MSQRRPVIAFGPEMPGFGSWEWVGADLAEELSDQYDTRLFRETLPECDAVVFIKFKPPNQELRSISQRVPVIYCPIDFYGSCCDIDADGMLLRRCSRVVVHCERLRKYFSSYATVEYLDHHLKYVSPLRERPLADGPIVWVGVRTNLPPLVDWVNRHSLPGELWVLTNPEDPSRPLHPTDYGFRADRPVRMDVWTGERHKEWLSLARAAIDIKGDDFRSRHKPSTKAIEFIASGVPLAMNASSSSVEHLEQFGLSVPDPADSGSWLSVSYARETIRVGQHLHDQLQRSQIAMRLRAMIDAVLKEHVDC